MNNEENKETIRKFRDYVKFNYKNSKSLFGHERIAWSHWKYACRNEIKLVAHYIHNVNKRECDNFQSFKSENQDAQNKDI